VTPVRQHSRRGTHGFALVEVLVSVLLFSIGIIALVRLLGAAVKDTGEIEYRAQAAALADSYVGQIWVDRANIGSYAEAAPGTALAELPAGSRTTVINGNVVTVTIGWQPPGAPARSHVVVATLAGN